MNKLQRITFYLLILIAGASWLVISAETGGNTVEAGIAPQAGFRAPDFTLQTTSGETYTLSDLQGYAVLVNMWATWCPPCEAEMPAIQKVYEEYRDQGFIVLAVNNTYQDNPLDIPPFAEKYNLTFPILLDQTSAVSRAYQIRSLPSSFFINRQGIITEVVIGGPMSEALLRTRVEQALK
ncbi:MAG: TlpA disulfide reductase family protein [Anaerolineales bacterium]|nr:TlpA disulfide reductase family protein [Anaerolineales bacterium]